MEMRSVTFWKEVADIAQSLITVLAILTGGYLYFKRRQRFPRAKITHQIADRLISEDKIVIRVVVTVVNQGEVLLSLVSGFTGVQQFAPCPVALLDSLKSKGHIVKEGKFEAEWDCLEEKKIVIANREREVEPGEEDEFNFDFVVSADVKSVLVYSYLKNKSKKGREMGWNKTSVYDLSSSCQK